MSFKPGDRIILNNNFSHVGNPYGARTGDRGDVETVMENGYYVVYLHRLMLSDTIHESELDRNRAPTFVGQNYCLDSSLLSWGASNS